MLSKKQFFRQQSKVTHKGRSLCAAYREALCACLKQWDLPAVVSLRSRGLFANAHRRYAGDMGLANPPDQMTCCVAPTCRGAGITDITSEGDTERTWCADAAHPHPPRPVR